MTETVPTPLVLFDGPCDLCRRSVRFLLRRERGRVLHFASLQSATGQRMRARYEIPEDVDAMILIEHSEAYLGSDAAFRICRYLKFPYRLFSVFRFLPGFLHRPVYHWIARNRHQWFGREAECPLPDPERESRFVDL